MKVLILSILSASASYFGAQKVVAQCTCSPRYMELTAYGELKSSDVVFIGKVAEVKRTKLRDGGYYDADVKFKVQQAWRRNLEEFVIVKEAGKFCGSGFDVNEEWLVYASANEDGTFTAGCYKCCSRTKYLSGAAEDLKEFEVNGEKPTKILKKTKSKMKGKPNKSFEPTAN